MNLIRLGILIVVISITYLDKTPEHLIAIPFLGALLGGIIMLLGAGSEKKVA